MPFLKTPGFLEPGGDEKLWRYMDLPKYLNLLTTNKIRFTRSDLLGDYFEGSTTAPTKQQMVDFLSSMFPKGSDSEHQISNLLNQEVNVNTFTRTHIYINSWHLNDGESEAMWKIYSKEFGIAIVSTTNRILESMQTEENILKSLVKYIDYQADEIPPGNYLSPFTYKRLSFKHEEEFRLLLYHKPEDLGPFLSEMPSYDYLSNAMPSGIHVPVNLDKLISVVHVSPFAPDWYFESVRDLSAMLNFTFEVKKSSLDPGVSSPVY